MLSGAQVCSNLSQYQMSARVLDNHVHFQFVAEARLVPVARCGSQRSLQRLECNFSKLLPVDIYTGEALNVCMYTHMVKHPEGATNSALIARSLL